ncbi:hypothetical protein GCK72_022642 [Caenorhabditis remanei]|uniref:Uncharacterized protein n=1 Tax=Caenorhabditis remanei TaxID=31234 RepID=A0A6A5FUN9_CAERE|nr:hypothetical protein GCK72_022642 [Caenorhabditis remanei]KAF1746189.1 hypothetical protein GCK72_022642 [Caenorhabditis remanei]
MNVAGIAQLVRLPATERRIGGSNPTYGEQSFSWRNCDGGVDWEWSWDGRSIPRGRPRHFEAQGPAPSNKTIGGTSQFLTEEGAMEERANNE